MNSDKLHDLRFPGESDEYRAARDVLLKEEMELRRQMERVAAQRRQLPPGGLVTEDYQFDSAAGPVRLSELFTPEKDSLVIYSFMYSTDMPRPCPSCSSILDGLDGSAPHINDRLNLVAVAKSPYGRIKEWADERGWRNLRLLSSAGNDYNTDYFAENEKWGQMPALNVFVKREGQVFHHYNSELLYAPGEAGMEPRHVDLLWPIWAAFDLTPEGRGDWNPKLYYSQ